MIPIPYEMSSGYLQYLEMPIRYRQTLAQCQVDIGNYLTNVSADIDNPLWILAIILQMASVYLQSTCKTTSIHCSSLLLSNMHPPLTCAGLSSV
jgi:hypothetical protein